MSWLDRLAPDLTNMIKDGNETAELSPVEGGTLWISPHDDKRIMLNDEKGGMALLAISNCLSVDGVTHAIETRLIRPVVLAALADAFDSGTKVAFLSCLIHQRRFHPSGLIAIEETGMRLGLKVLGCYTAAPWRTPTIASQVKASSGSRL
jgi:hypothetical protein